MHRHKILCNQGHCGRIRILAEKRIVSYANTHQDIQIRLRIVEQQSLHDWIADNAIVCQRRYVNVQVSFHVAFQLAANYLHLKPGLPEKLCQDTRFPQHGRAGCYADKRRPHAGRKLDRVLNACRINRFSADYRGRFHYEVVLGFVVKTQRLVMHFFSN